MNVDRGPWRPHEIVGIDKKPLDLDACWRCPLVKRAPGRATQHDPMHPDKDDRVLVCVPCASDRSNHPNRPRANA